MLIETSRFADDLINPRVVDKVIYTEWLYNRLDQSKKIVWLFQLPALETRWVEELGISYPTLSHRPDKIILNARTENYNETHWKVLLDAVHKLGYNNSDILIIDANFVNPTKDYTHATDHLFLNRYQFYKELGYKDILPRKYKFVSLAAVARPNRIMFTKELLMRGLEQHGIVTCGSSSMFPVQSEKLFDLLDLGEFRNRFPLIFDKPYVTSKMEDRVWAPLIDARCNVVIETCFEDYPPIKHHQELGWMHGGDGLFLTEKTVKAFAYYQLPIFVASKGFVAEIRKLGFDLFDDIINHNYDNIDDPKERLSAVADELHRLINLENLSDNNLKSRLIKNHNMIETVYIMKKNELALKILKWFEQ